MSGRWTCDETTGRVRDAAGNPIGWVDAPSGDWLRRKFRRELGRAIARRWFD